MRPKRKAFVYNFIVFAVIFLTIRIVLEFLWPGNRAFLAIGSAILTMIISPKFAAIKTNSGEKLLMKSIFSKKVKEL